MPSEGNMTPLHHRALEFIRSYIETNGFSPSYVEIGASVGLKSKSGIHRVIICLVDRGYLKREPGKNRSLRINDGGESVAYEQGYQQGFYDAMASIANQPKSPSSGSSPSLRSLPAGSAASSPEPALYSEVGR